MLVFVWLLEVLVIIINRLFVVVFWEVCVKVFVCGNNVNMIEMRIGFSFICL